MFNKHEFTPVFVDVMLDPVLAATFDKKVNPQLFVIYNETQRVYAWDYEESMNDTISWVLDKKFLNSKVQFDSLRTYPWQLFRFFQMREQYTDLYFELIGNYVNEFINENFPDDLKESWPITAIYDTYRDDTFQMTYRNQFNTFIGLCLITFFIWIQLFRMCCCKKVIVLKKKKNVDKDTK